MYKVTILSSDYQLPLRLTVYGVNPAHSASHPYEWQRSGGSWQMIVVRLNRDQMCSSVSVYQQKLKLDSQNQKLFFMER